MSEELIIRLCSPTLAGFKVASLFSCDCSSQASLNRTIKSLNHRLFSKGLFILPVKFSAGKALIYVFRPKLLDAYLKDARVRKILENLGYDTDDMYSCILRIISRLRDDQFPHEIGIFLGYPPEDVQGFIDNKGMNYKICGQWKVYGDEEKCNCFFEKCVACTRDYLRSYRSGITIERLTVVV